MDTFFQQIYGSNLDDTRSDKSEIIRSIIDENDLDKCHIIMIGDRKYDIIGANNNGIASIGVEYGYGSRDELLESKPTNMVKTVEGLYDYFNREIAL
jgi:phosphoglycolate phosphatase